MDKAFRVARTEYMNAIRSKAFIIGVLMLPVMMGLGIGIPALHLQCDTVVVMRFAVGHVEQQRMLEDCSSRLPIAARQLRQTEYSPQRDERVSIGEMAFDQLRRHVRAPAVDRRLGRRHPCLDIQGCGIRRRNEIRQRVFEPADVAAERTAQEQRRRISGLPPKHLVVARSRCFMVAGLMQPNRIVE